MRFAVFADLHGNSSALDAILADVERQGIGDIVNLGDCFSGPLDALGTAERLIDLDIPTVMGNHDRFIIETRFGPAGAGPWEAWVHPVLKDSHYNWLSTLPKTISWNGVLLCHGTPTSDTTNWLDDRGDNDRMRPTTLDEIEHHAKGIKESLMLSAHTHLPRAVRLSDGRIVANPGAAGCPAYLDDRFDPPFVAETGTPDARYAICDDESGQGWTVRLCTVPYDPSAMATMARAKGAESWAIAIETGWTSPLAVKTPMATTA